MMVTSDWRKEFGDEWAVPTQVLDLVARGELVDHSWHNDVCPSFVTRAVDQSDAWLGDGRGVRLWIDHPDPERRELPHADRYFVTAGDGSDQGLYSGDDLDEALRVLRATPPTPWPTTTEEATQ
jgi:hypothetical protein